MQSAKAPAARPDLPAPRLPDCTRTALFLDLDGTLLDFAGHPDEVEVDPSLPSLLDRLARAFGGAMAPISGRSLCEVDALLGRGHAAAAGLHGAQMRDADGVMLTGMTRLPAELAALLPRAQALAARLAGVFVEAKPNGIALHYRRAPQLADAVRAIAADLQQEAGPGIALQAGNHVVELKPASSDKGAAVATLMRSAPFAGRAPWVIGDDLTDEHAFERALQLGGVGVIVGPRRPTAARYALASPAATRAWLAALADHCASTAQAGDDT